LPRKTRNLSEWLIKILTKEIPVISEIPSIKRNKINVKTSENNFIWC
jgi:hypothetical protein